MRRGMTLTWKGVSVGSVTRPEARDPFADDVLGRLIKSNRDYQQTHGHYIVPLAQRLLDARADLDDEREMAKQVIETLRNLHDNWERIVDEQDGDGGPLIENLLYWAIDDLCGNA